MSETGGDIELTLCKNILASLYPEIKNSTEEELSEYSLVLSKCYKEMKSGCIRFSMTISEPSLDQWKALSRMMTTNIKKIDSITQSICVNNYSSNVKNPLYKLLSPQLRERIFDNVKRPSLSSGQLVQDEFLFFNVEKGTGLLFKKVIVRETYDIMQESLRIMLLFTEGTHTNKDCIKMLHDNLERKTDTLIVNEEIMTSVFDAIFPTTAQQSSLMIISSMSPDEDSPLRKIIDPRSL